MSKFDQFVSPVIRSAWFRILFLLAVLLALALAAGAPYCAGCQF